MAEAFYNFYTKTKSATSAGTQYVGPRYDYIPREDVVKVMNEKGIDITYQRIKQVTPEGLQNIDEILVLCAAKHLPYFIRQSGIKTTIVEIKDLYDSSLQGLRDARDNIEKLVLEYIKGS